MARFKNDDIGGIEKKENIFHIKQKQLNHRERGGNRVRESEIL